MLTFADDIDEIVLQMIKIRLFLLLLVTGTLQGFAQRRLVVVDVETLIPVVGANVISKDGNCTTDSLGFFNVSDSCKTLSFSHVNYESRLVNLTEVGDTIYMISKLLNVKEVVVFGHGKREEIPDALKKQLEMEKENAKLASIDPSSGNLLTLLGYLIPKKWRKNTKEARRKRMKLILENY
jgi:hypothetical protein